MPQISHLSSASAKEHEHRAKGCEIFVGGISRSITESMLHEMFSSCGEILEIRIMKDQQGTPKGFCFVRFATKDAALKAQKEKDGYVLQGKKLGVQLSSDQDSLFLGNLCKDWSFEEFDRLVRQAFRDVISVDLAMASKTGEPVDRRRQNRGFAFVRFSSHAAAARAHRIGSKQDFLLGDKCHPVVDWAEKEPELDPDELAKIKVAFVGNLPKNVDEGFLKKLFEPFGKLEKVALSRKGHFPVGFIHFAKRSDLDNAIKEMDGKTVQGPERGPKFQIQVSIARPVEKDRKRARDESQNKSTSRDPSRSGSWPASSKDDYSGDFVDDHKLKAPRLGHSREVPEAVDPYEKAVASLPSPLVERLLQIFRLGIATRYDIDIFIEVECQAENCSFTFSTSIKPGVQRRSRAGRGRQAGRQAGLSRRMKMSLGRTSIFLLLSFFSSAWGIESPQFTVVHSESDFEIRYYRESEWMTATVRGISFEKATKEGFHRLYQYLHGANSNSSQFVKTSPILTSIIPGDQSSEYVVKIYFPGNFHTDPPDPLPKLNLQLLKWGNCCVAVRKFSGFARDKNIGKEADSLFTILGKVGSIVLEDNHDYTIAQYNASFHLSRRLNEVWINVVRYTEGAHQSNEGAC